LYAASSEGLNRNAAVHLASARGRETLAYEVVTLTSIIFAIFGAVSLLRRL